MTQTGVGLCIAIVLLSPLKTVGSDASFFHLGLSYCNAKWSEKEDPAGMSFFLGAEYQHIQILGDIGILQENWPIRNEGTSEDPIRPSNRDAMLGISIRARYGQSLKWGFWPYAGVGTGYGKLSEEENEKNLFLFPILEIGVNNHILRYINFGINYRNDRLVINRLVFETGLRFSISQ